MSFGGSVAAMIASIKMNKRERKSKPFSKRPDAKTGLSLSIGTATEEELLEIRTRVQGEQRKATKNTVVTFIIILVLALAMFWFLAYY